MEKFWGEMFVQDIMSGWIESTESHVDLRWRCGCLFTFVGASRGHLCDGTALLYHKFAAECKKNWKSLSIWQSYIRPGKSRPII